MNIFVGNLSLKTTEQELQKEFEPFGEVESVKIITDRETLKSRGFAFVVIQDPAQAAAAITGINGKVLDGHILRANEARPRDAGGSQNRERSGRGYSSGDRFSIGSSSTGKDRAGSGYAGNDDIYDSKGGNGRRDRNKRGSGGRSGGRRSPR